MNAIDRLVAIEDIKRCKFKYCASADAKDWAAFGSTFTEDAVWDERDYPIARHPVTREWIKTNKYELEFLEGLSRVLQWPVVGRKAIEAAGRQVGDAMLSFHKLFLPDIEIISSTTAKAVWPMEDVLNFPEGSPIRFLQARGHYHETYESVNGQWLIKTLWLTRQWVDIE